MNEAAAMSYRANSCGDVCRAELQKACRRGGCASPTLQSMTKTRALALALALALKA
jgi:hypothetical protein